MPPAVVVVTFYSRTGETERLATAAAVGAVQARAGIRMRRLPDMDHEAGGTDVGTELKLGAAKEPGGAAKKPGGAAKAPGVAAAELARMRREYVAPKEADVLAADALIVGLPPDVGPSAPECAPFFDLLAKLHAEGKLAGKAAAAVGKGPSLDAVNRLLAGAGLAVVTPDTPGAVDDVERAIALGRRVVAVARSG